MRSGGMFETHSLTFDMRGLWVMMPLGRREVEN